MKVNDNERRFLYHGFAQSVGGMLTRPEKTILNDGASLILPEHGGKKNGRSSGFRSAGVVSFASASTELEGREVEGKKYETKVKAVVEGINILDVFTVDRAVAELTTKGSLEDSETEVVLGECKLEGLKVHGRPVEVELDIELLNALPTLQALENRFERDDTFRRVAKQRFLWGKLDDSAPEYIHKSFGWAGEQVEKHNKLPNLQGTAPCTIVKKLEVDCEGVKAHGHTLRIHNFGRVFLGNVLVSRGLRRLSILTFDLGSPAEGMFEMCAVEGNGYPFP